MEHLLDGLKSALIMIITFDPEVVEITLISLRISLTAIFFAVLVGVPVGFFIGINRFKGRNAVITVLNTLMAFPTVVVGLMVYSLISSKGPFGVFGLLFTPYAMMIGQFVLAMPIVIALTVSATQNIDPKVRGTAVALGASSWQSALAVVYESRFAIVAAIVAGFGRIIGEVGASMMLGGNIKGYTRNIPTSIALETSKGDFGLALALGFVLLAIALFVNFFLRFLQSHRGR